MQKKQYISLVHQLSSSETPKQPVDHSSTPSSQDGDVVVSVKDKMHIITLNRPTRKNALKLEVSFYRTIGLISSSFGHNLHIMIRVPTGPSKVTEIFRSLKSHRKVIGILFFLNYTFLYRSRIMHFNLCFLMDDTPTFVQVSNN